MNTSQKSPLVSGFGPSGRSVLARCFVGLTAAALLLSGTGCGKGGTKPAANAGETTTKLPPANPQAVTKMVQGAKMVKERELRERGVALLREAIQIDPNLWEARMNLGIGLALSGDLVGAENELDRARKAAPFSPEVAMALGEVQHRRGDDKAAASTLGEFVKRNPDSVDVRSRYVTALRNAGETKDAILEAREVLVRRSGDANALSELALCHLAKEEKDIALLLAKQAIDADGKNATPHRTMGLIHLTSGEDALAFQSFQKASQLDPRDTTARLNMASVLMRAGAYGKAEDQYKAILSVAADDLDAQVGYAAALRATSDGKGPKLEEARAILERVLLRDPHQVSALLNVGVLYNDYLKNPEKAKPYFVRFLDDAHPYHPSRGDAEKALAMIKLSVPDKPAPAPVAPAPTSGGKKK